VIAIRGRAAPNCGRRKGFSKGCRATLGRTPRLRLGQACEAPVPTWPVEKFSSGKPAGAPGTAVIACRAFKIQVCEEAITNAGRDPLGREETGSVVGIHFEVADMYTGTLITDLMAAVERAELRAERSAKQETAEQQECNGVCRLQVPVANNDLVLMGAA